MLLLLICRAMRVFIRCVMIAIKIKQLVLYFIPCSPLPSLLSIAIGILHSPWFLVQLSQTGRRYIGSGHILLQKPMHISVHFSPQFWFRGQNFVFILILWEFYDNKYIRSSEKQQTINWLPCCHQL